MRATAGRSLVISASLAIVLLACSSAFAQGLMEAQAFVGEPFGVGSITFNLPAEILPEPLGLEGVGLSEKSGRVFYPAMRAPALANVLKEFLREDSPLTSGGPVRQEVGGILRGMLNRPPRTTLYFLFRGAEPLDLAIQAGKSIPAGRPAAEQPGRAPPPDAGLVARLCRAAPPLAAKARFPAAGRNVPREYARPPAQPAAAAREAGGVGLSAIRTGVGRAGRERRHPHGH